MGHNLSIPLLHCYYLGLHTVGDGTGTIVLVSLTSI